MTLYDFWVSMRRRPELTAGLLGLPVHRAIETIAERAGYGFIDQSRSVPEVLDDLAAFIERTA